MWIMEKEQYEIPEMEIIRLDSTDVITASGGDDEFEG